MQLISKMPAHAPSIDILQYQRTHARSASTASSNGTSSSTDSFEHLPRPTQSPKGHKKSTSFTKFFSTKEPSAVAFEKLAELQRQELDRTGQKLPFGVPSQKLPESARDDYKNEKRRAKEMAKLYEAAKEKLKLGDDSEQRQQRRTSVIDSMFTSGNAAIKSQPSARSEPSPSKGSTPSTSRSTARLQRLPSLDPLPENPSIDAVASRPPLQVLPPSPPVSNHSSANSSMVKGVLTGRQRKEALPWE